MVEKPEPVNTAGSNINLFRSRTGLHACLILTLASATFAFAHVVGRGIHAEVPPVGLSFWRWLLGAICRCYRSFYPGLKTNAPHIRKHIGPLALCLAVP